MTADPTWKNTFNGDLGDFVYIDDAAKVACEASYPYLFWRGRIYEANPISGTASPLYGYIDFDHEDEDCRNCCRKSWDCDEYQRRRED